MLLQKTMKKLVFLFVMLSLTLQSQNLIQNGSEFIDSDSNGLANCFEVSSTTNDYQIDSGSQYVSSEIIGSCSQALIFQQFSLLNTRGKTFKLDFDLVASTDVYVIIWTAYYSGHCIGIISKGSYQSYSITYQEDWYQIAGVCFYTGGTDPAWLRLDNLSFTEQFATGIEKVGIKSSDSFTYDLSGRKLTEPPQSGWFIKNGKTWNRFITTDFH